jgi:GNAT superfamily N-acetyltransferase
VIVFDGSKIVGASTGLPLKKEIEGLQKPFIEKHIDPNSIFFFSESVLLKAYRGRGIGHHFFDIREEYALQLKEFEQISFCCVSRPEHDTKRPKDYLPLDDFWRKRGFVSHPEMCYQFQSKDSDDEEYTEKTMVFWIKDLHLHPASCGKRAEAKNYTMSFAT